MITRALCRESIDASFAQAIKLGAALRLQVVQFHCTVTLCAAMPRAAQHKDIIW
jgi:hypothetical protein